MADGPTAYLAEDEEDDSLATAAEGEALGTTKALQPAADSAMQAISPSFMTNVEGKGCRLKPKIGLRGYTNRENSIL